MEMVRREKTWLCPKEMSRMFINPMVLDSLLLAFSKCNSCYKEGVWLGAFQTMTKPYDKFTIMMSSCSSRILLGPSTFRHFGKRRYLWRGVCWAALDGAFLPSVGKTDLNIAAINSKNVWNGTIQALMYSS